MSENIEVFEQNSIRIRGSIGVIYVDPFRMKEAPKDADFILITHDHYDHFSPEDIAKTAGPHTILIVPENMKDKAMQLDTAMSDIVTVKPGEKKEVEGLVLETVPAYNKLKPFHPKKAGWVGYILEVDGSRIYIAGDTDATDEAENVRCDVAMVPVGGTYTMNAKKAAELVNKIEPKVAIPVHYGTVVGNAKDGEVFASDVKGSIRVELKIKL